MAISAKLAGQRKEQLYSVYQNKDTKGRVIVQSGTAIGALDIGTGKGVLNWRGSNSKYFVHLALAEDYQFPPEFVAAVRNSLA